MERWNLSKTSRRRSRFFRPALANMKKKLSILGRIPTLNPSESSRNRIRTFNRPNLSEHYIHITQSEIWISDYDRRSDVLQVF